MLNKTWRVILLLIALILVIWPGLFSYANWVAVVLIAILLIGEIGSKNCCDKPMAKAMNKPMPKAKKRKRR